MSLGLNSFESLWRIINVSRDHKCKKDPVGSDECDSSTELAQSEAREGETEELEVQ